MEADGLTDADVALAFARCEMANGGWPPTLGEVSARLGRARSTIHQRLARMVAAGLLETRAYGRGAVYRATSLGLAEPRE